MDPIEEYFFDNNIEVYRTIQSNLTTYYSTSEGEYFQEGNHLLFKIVGDRRVTVDLKIKTRVSSDDPESLTNYRREQLILKLSYEALIKARKAVQELEKSKLYKSLYQEGEKHHWKLVEAREKADELSKLYDDLARDRVELVETGKAG